MPSTSPAQQRLFGMALATKRGDISTPSGKVASMAKRMPERTLRDFAVKPKGGFPHGTSFRHHKKKGMI